MYAYTDISLQEIPNEISLILYSGGCNLYCPWCFNPDLREKKPLSYKQMKDAIDEHRDFVGGVVFSGGEPLLNPNLNKVIKYVKSNGLKVKLNTNGLVSTNVQKNWHLEWIDYINVSLKGIPGKYGYFLESKPFCNLSLYAETIEYSLVYTPAIWPTPYLIDLYKFLKSTMKRDWFSLLKRDRWTQPDIFTIVQMQPTNCLNEYFNHCRAPNKQECIDAAYIFRDIPRKKLMVETAEFGRTVIK